MGITLMDIKDVPINSKNRYASFARNALKEFDESGSSAGRIDLPDNVPFVRCRAALYFLRRNGEIPEGIDFCTRQGFIYLMKP